MNRNCITLFLTCLIMCSPAIAPGRAQNSQSYAQDGKAAFDAGHYDQAAALFASQVAASPQDALSHYYLGLSYHCLA